MLRMDVGARICRSEVENTDHVSLATVRRKQSARMHSVDGLVCASATKPKIRTEMRTVMKFEI